MVLEGVTPAARPPCIIPGESRGQEVFMATRVPTCLAILALSAAAPVAGAPPEIRPPAPAAPLVSPSNLMVEQEVTVTTRVTGVVDSIEADRGETVRKGQPLATLDQREFRLDLRAAEETLKVNEADFRRAQELFKLNLTSQAELEQKKTRYELAQVELERAKLVIDRSVVRAPFDGVVADRFIRVGEKVLVDENKPLFRITALEPLLARAFLPGKALPALKTGQEVLVVARDFPDVRSTGRISFVSPVLDPGSGTVQVLVKVRRDAKGFLRPGMAVNLTFGGAPPAP
jgi:membrane fusion protein (multidrug efflux system)